MSAAWAGVVVAMAMCALAIVGLALGRTRDARKQGAREGKVDEILRRLTDLGTDHEGRIRTLERQ